MGRKLRPVMFCGLLWAAFAVPAQAARLNEVSVTNSPEALLVYVKLQDAFSGEIRKAVFSGVPTTFSFYITLHEVRTFWSNRTLADLVLTHTIKYNNLKNEFVVKRSWENDTPHQVRSFEEARRLMTEISGLGLISIGTLVRGERYRVSAKARLSKINLPFYLHYLLLITSHWEFETDWHSIEFDYE